MRFFKALLVLVIVVAAAGQFVLAPVVQGAAEQAISHQVGQQASVKLESKPQLKLLFGQVDHFQLTAQDVQVQGLVLDQLTASADNIRASLPALLQGHLVARSSQPVQVDIVIGPKHLQDLLLRQLPLLKSIQLNFSKAPQVKASGTASLAGIPVPFAMQGHLQAGLDSQQRVKTLQFKVQSLDLGQGQLPAAVKQRLQQSFQANLTLNINQLTGGGLAVHSADVESSGLHLRGQESITAMLAQLGKG